MADEQFKYFLSLYDVGEIADTLADMESPWDSGVGMKAQGAMGLLNALMIKDAVEKLTASAEELSSASDRIARRAVVVAWVSFIAVLAALVVTLVK